MLLLPTLLTHSCTFGAAERCQLLAGIWLQDMKQLTTEVTHSDGNGREEVEKHIDPSQRSSAWSFLSRQLLPQPWQHEEKSPWIKWEHTSLPATPHISGAGGDGLRGPQLHPLMSPLQIREAHHSMAEFALQAPGSPVLDAAVSEGEHALFRPRVSQLNLVVVCSPATALTWAVAAPGAETTSPDNTRSTCRSCLHW